MPDREPYDAGDEKSVGKRKTKAQLIHEREVEELRKVLSTREGKRVIWRILEYCKLYNTSFTGNSTTFYNEGRREVGLWLLTELEKVDKYAYVNMQTEALNLKEDING